MPRVLIDRPWEAENSVAAMEEWIAEVREMQAQFASDAEASEDLARELESSEPGLAALRARDAAGIRAPVDDGLIDLDGE